VFFKTAETLTTNTTLKCQGEEKMNEVYWRTRFIEKIYSRLRPAKPVSADKFFSSSGYIPQVDPAAV